MLVPTLELVNGVQIPQLGFGTYKMTEDVTKQVLGAIEVGYRHIDTAQMYGNEAEVGQAWVDSGLGREAFFITSKLDNTNHLREQALPSFEKTLEDLQTDYVDLFLIHWPMPQDYDGDYVSTWKIMEEIYASGRAKAVGVSNFEPEHLQKVMNECDLTPMVNQIESQPYLPNDAVHQFDRDNGIITEAWSPLARGKAVSDPLLAEIGSAHGKSASQVALRWGIQRGDVVFPKASSIKRQRENFEIFDFVLSPEEMMKIATLDEGEAGRCGSHPNKKWL